MTPPSPDAPSVSSPQAASTATSERARTTAAAARVRRWVGGRGAGSWVPQLVGAGDAGLDGEEHALAEGHGGGRRHELVADAAGRPRRQVLVDERVQQPVGADADRGAVDGQQGDEVARARRRAWPVDPVGRP